MGMMAIVPQECLVHAKTGEEVCCESVITGGARKSSIVTSFVNTIGLLTC